MIGAIVQDNVVTGLMVINAEQVEEMAAALHAEIVDAANYGLLVGDLRVSGNWTRNEDGEQVVLTAQSAKDYSAYTAIKTELDGVKEQLDALQSRYKELAQTQSWWEITTGSDVAVGTKVRYMLKTYQCVKEHKKSLITTLPSNEEYWEEVE